MRSRENSLNRREFFTMGTLSLGSVMAVSLPFSGALMSSCNKAKSNTIPTLTGCIKPEYLGTTLMHEHLLFFSGPRPENPFTPIPDSLRNESVDFVVSLLKDAERAGIRTIVDLTPHRPVDLYQQIAKHTTVNIVPSTGFYRRSKIPGWMAEMDDEKQIGDHMLKEATEGIDGTKILAGIIKVAGEGISLTDWEKKVFRAAARVHRTTGLPVATHTGGAVEQFDVLVKAGTDPRKIVLSHVDVGRKGQPGELLNIVKEGGYLEVDTFGQDFYTPWAELVSFLRSICDAGFSNRIFISIDSNWHWGEGKKLFEGAEAPNFDPNASNRTFAYMMTYAVPKLLSSGFNKEEINTFLVDNPRNFFSGG